METIRILHILHSMNRGGAENALMNYYRHIDRERVQFDFLLTAKEKCQFEDEIMSLGGKIYRVPILKMSNPFPYIKGVYKFFKLHSEYKIVHSHTSSKSVFPLGIAKSVGVPIRISHSHNAMTEGGVSGLIRNSLMPLLKITANTYMSCGEQAANWLYGKKFTENGKVKIIRNVIEVNKFRLNSGIGIELRNELNIPQDTFVVGHVARFSQQKNHLFAIDIFKEILELEPNSIYLMIGDGVLEYEIDKKIKDYGISNKVRMIGVVSNVYDYEQAMDAFILPSFYEGLPLSIIEAQVSGLPCFTSAGRVSSECSVTDLVTYLPLEAGAKVWAEKIYEYRMKARTDRRDEIAKAGYDAETSAKELQEYYINKYKECAIR